jgi:hypothetical protein
MSLHASDLTTCRTASGTLSHVVAAADEVTNGGAGRGHRPRPVAKGATELPLGALAAVIDSCEVFALLRGGCRQPHGCGSG